jgi:uncharacterized membrane protein YccC
MVINRKDYLQEIQRFTTGQHLNSGIRITAGVIIPMLVMIFKGWLSAGIPFLFAALFVSLTDTPGPIHHRINGMVAAVILNTITAVITTSFFNNPIALAIVITVMSFTYSMFGIYGSRASAVGTLALVMGMITMSPVRNDFSPIMTALLTAGGGIWYTSFSLLLNRLQPYRLVEQALGENLLLIAEYIRARAAFYKDGMDFNTVYNRVMKEQVNVIKAQTQIRELLFKTRQLVGDASPKSRSMMMIFLESLDLFEETMYSYQDYDLLHKHIDPSLLRKFYRTIIEVVAEFEIIGLTVQNGKVVKNVHNFEKHFEDLLDRIHQQKQVSTAELEQYCLESLQQTVYNLRGIVTRLNQISLYTNLKVHVSIDRFPHQDLELPSNSTPITLSLFKDNLTLQSNTFRFAIRLTCALLIGMLVSIIFNISHAYWVMLTILTILKPIYHVTRKRNIERVTGTLLGVIISSGIIFIIPNDTVLLFLMVLSFLMAYSLLRINYFLFATFITIYVIITFHFLNPIAFKDLIGERLLDTLIGSIIAAISARFILPVWQHDQIDSAIIKCVKANANYFVSSWAAFRDPQRRREFDKARNEAIVALTNLTENFQQMLAEPKSSGEGSQTHQFVIASHSLISRISALRDSDFTPTEQMEPWVNAIEDTMTNTLDDLATHAHTGEQIKTKSLPVISSLHPLSIIFSLARDIRGIVSEERKKHSA